MHAEDGRPIPQTPRSGNRYSQVSGQRLTVLRRTSLQCSHAAGVTSARQTEFMPCSRRGPGMYTMRAPSLSSSEQTACMVVSFGFCTFFFFWKSHLFYTENFSGMFIAPRPNTLRTLLNAKRVLMSSIESDIQDFRDNSAFPSYSGGHRQLLRP